MCGKRDRQAQACVDRSTAEVQPTVPTKLTRAMSATTQHRWPDLDGKRSGRGQTRSEPMQYRSMEQIASEADVFTIPSLSRRGRLERWAEALARQPAQLCAIPEVEYGPRRERDARRADHSPLTVAYEDPVLRAAGLRGDTIGDAAEFFGLSHAQLHHLVCYCHYGLTMDPQATAAQVRGLTQRADACMAAITSLAAVGASFAALKAAVALAGALF